MTTGATARQPMMTANRDDLITAEMRSERKRIIGRLLRHRGGVVGAVILLILFLVAIFAPIIAPYDPIKITGADALQGPSAKHLMGTDNFGRDILSRVVFGARLSLRMGFIAIAIAAVIGTLIGLVAGSYGGWIESLLMRFVDALMAFPGILLALAVTAMLGPGLTNSMIAVGISFIPSFARLVRSSALQVKEMTYIEAARSIGCGTPHIIRKHIFPNVLTPIIVLSTLGVASAILIGAALSFLGLGAQPPSAEWGIMLAEGRQFMRTAWWIMAFPGLAITITVIAANLIGDGVRDALDPRLKV
ncbi:MAG TPA: nickel transporter permease [Nitrolancea sp.]